jgi:hypothetical protein
MKRITCALLTAGVFAFLSGEAAAAVIKLGPGCNIYNAIRAANLDRRVGTCRPGRGPDRIVVGYRYSEPPRPYPTIRTKITIAAKVSSDPNHIIIPQLHPTANTRLFTVAKRGSLTLSGISISGRDDTIHVKGRLTVKNGGWVHAYVGCSIGGQPGSSIKVNHAIITADDQCAIGLNRSKLTAYQMNLRGLNAPPSFGIHAVDSTVSLTSSTIADSEVGVDLERSTLTIRDTQFEGNGQDIQSDGGSVVTAPPAEGTALAPVTEMDEPPADAPVGSQPSSPPGSTDVPTEPPSSTEPPLQSSAPPPEGEPPPPVEEQQPPLADQQPPVDEPPPPKEQQPPLADQQPPVDEPPPSTPYGEQPLPDNGSSSGEPPQESLAPESPPASEQPPPAAPEQEAQPTKWGVSPF